MVGETERNVIQVDLRGFTAVLIRLGAVVGAIDVLRYFPSSIVAYWKMGQESPYVGYQIQADLGWSLIFLALVCVLFFNATKVARLICPDSEVFEFESSARLWIIPLYQLTGLILVLVGLHPLAIAFHNGIGAVQSQGDSKSMWNTLLWAWDAFVAVGAGWLLLRYPRRIYGLVLGWSD